LSDDLIAKGAQTSLSKHPLITSVTPQRRVTRSLTSVVDDDDAVEEVEEESELDDQEGEEEMEKWTRGRRSLAFGKILNDVTNFGLSQSILSLNLLF
jgi:hypothetical protein